MPILTEEERLGTLFAGRYRLESILGTGGTGVVFEATHTWTGRRVAVKLLKPEYARDLGRVRRFLQEARAATGIEHPNVVQVLDMGNEDDGTVYLVLELLEGESLGAYLQRHSTVGPREALELLVPVMSALVAAHDKGIIHRDLKPDNIFLYTDSNGQRAPKLLDFGMAKMLDSAWGSATQTGTLVGTPFYMSPEQAEGKADIGPPADVWSMGVILYRCLTGRLPFFADTPTALLIAIVQRKPPPVAQLAPELPKAFADAVDRALIGDRDKRWGSMGAFLAALERAASEAAIPLPESERLPEVSDPFDPGPRQDSIPKEVAAGPRSRLPWVAAAVALLAGAAITLALASPDSRARGSEPPAPEEVALLPDPPPTSALEPSLLEIEPADAELRGVDDEPAAPDPTVEDEPERVEPERTDVVSRADRTPRRSRNTMSAAENDRTPMRTGTMRLPNVTREW